MEENMLVINSNETNGKIQLISDNISIEINSEDKNHNIVEKSSVEDLNIPTNFFDDDLDIIKLAEKQYKKKYLGY